MKAKTEQALGELKEVYRSAFADSRHSQSDEALALGVEITTAHNYLRCDTDRHLPAGLVPESLFAPQIVDYLAAKIGGVYVHLSGPLNGTSNDELASILRIAAQIVREDDPVKKAKLFKQIETKAARAAKEEDQ